MRFQPIAFILLIILILLVQANFLSATNSPLASINLLAVMVIWLVWLKSPWVWGAAAVGGWLADLWQGLIGPQILALLVLTLIVFLLQKTIATTGRLGQFLVVSGISLLSFFALELVFAWLFGLVFLDWFKLSGLDYSWAISFGDLFKFIGVNLILLALLYFLSNKKSTLSSFKAN